MRGRQIVILCVSGAALVNTPLAAGQIWGTQPPRDGACFYQNANFRGQYFCVAIGDDVSTVASAANDQVSSIRIVGSAEVTAFRDSRFQGTSKRFTSDVSNLDDEGFDNEISSIRVRARASNSRPTQGSQSSAIRNPEAVVRRAYQDVLGRDPDPSGMSTFRSHIIDDGWTEQQVRMALRASDEYREKNTMTMEKARDIVRRAYLAVLKREPDPASEGWVQRVFADKWTQADVERELRKSPEYRER